MRNTVIEQKGFTLIELVLGIALMVIISAAVVQTLGASVQSCQYNQKRQYELQQARQALNGVVERLRSATQISQPADVGSAAEQLTYQVGGDVFTLQLAAKGDGKQLICNGQPLTDAIIASWSVTRLEGGNMLLIKVVVYSPDNASSGKYELEAKAFAPNVTPMPAAGGSSS